MFQSFDQAVEYAEKHGTNPEGWLIEYWDNFSDIDVSDTGWDISKRLHLVMSKTDVYSVRSDTFGTQKVYTAREDATQKVKTLILSASPLLGEGWE